MSHGSSPASSTSQTALCVTETAAPKHSSSSWGYIAHAGDPDGDPGFCLQPGLALASCAHLGSESESGKSFSRSVCVCDCLSNK